MVCLNFIYTKSLFSWFSSLLSSFGFVIMQFINASWHVSCIWYKHSLQYAQKITRLPEKIQKSAKCRNTASGSKHLCISSRAWKKLFLSTIYSYCIRWLRNIIMSLYVLFSGSSFSEFSVLFWSNFGFTLVWNRDFIILSLNWFRIFFYNIFSILNKLILHLSCDAILGWGCNGHSPQTIKYVFICLFTCEKNSFNVT